MARLLTLNYRTGNFGFLAVGTKPRAAYNMEPSRLLILYSHVSLMFKAG